VKLLRVVEAICPQQQLVFAVLNEVLMNDWIGAILMVAVRRALAVSIALVDLGLPAPSLRGSRSILADSIRRRSS